MKHEAFWQAFLKAGGRPEGTQPHDCFHFDNSEASANHLLALVLAGHKTATTSALASFAFEGIPAPQAGDLSIVTDWAGTPRCVIETTSARTLPFAEVTWEMAAREGEDESLDGWRENHIRFLTSCGEAEGFTFTWSLPVVFEEFKVVYRA